MSPRGLQPNPNLLSPQKQINSDWVPVCSWFSEKSPFIYMRNCQSIPNHLLLGRFHENRPSYKIGRGFFSSDPNCPLAHTARTQNVRVCVSVQNQSTEYMANWGTVKRHLYSVSKRWRANGSFHSETDFWVNLIEVVSSQCNLNRVFLTDSRVLSPKILGTCCIIFIEQRTCQAIFSKTKHFCM